MIRTWETDDLYFPRMKIVMDALEAHLEGKYTLSIPALLPQIEGIASQIMGERPGKSRARVTIAIEERYSGLWPATAKETLLSYVTNRVYTSVDFGEFAEWLNEAGLSEKEVLHRHAILHGVQIDYASQENSLRVFLILDALSWLKRSQTS